MKKLYKSLVMAISMFTILPTPYIEWDDEGVKNMMKFYPVVGLIVGGIWSLIYYLISFSSCLLILKSVIIMMIPFIITGMIHLDGFMDVCDAILSRRDKEEKLRILKDSTTGAFAVVSLVMLFFLQFAGICSLIEKQTCPYILILIPITSRSIVAYYLLNISTIKESSLGAYFKKGTGTFDKVLMITVLILTCIISALLFKYKGILMIVFMFISISLSVFKCVKEFGGISGDVAGFALVVGEVVGILSLSF